ncbi:MAG TPA: lipopolysaccharide heptosyltransferase II [Chthoniobacterales bacterium]|jgi:lipopolysaccharide heptosyltransferase II|nr:lipopolysaccharide heptosyltransferase II [Chthoniobacterales bacterium]
MFEYFVYLIYRAGFALVGLLPLSVAFAVGNALGCCAWLVLGKYRALGFHNIDIAFGAEKSAREKRRIVRKHFQRLGANLLSSLKLAGMPLDEARACVQVENADAAHRVLKNGRPIIIILSHIGNWELYAQMFPAVLGYIRNSTIYQPLKNRYIDKHVRILRGRAGVETFDRNEGFQKVIELLRAGGGVGILGDQHAGDQGLWVPFFGKLASTTSLPALLAKRTGAAVLGTTIYTDGPGSWRMVFADRIDNPGDSIEAITAKANELLEKETRAAPEDGFWLHNRWKTPRPNFLLVRYKRGVFLPKDFPREKLKPFRILIRSSNWLGDAVMSVPAVRAIKKGRPDAHVTVLAPEKIAPMWKLIAEVDEVLSLPGKSLVSATRLIARQPKFDVAILFPNSLRAALEVWSVSRKVGYRGHARHWLLNQIVRESKRPRPPEHHAIRFLRIAADCGADVDLHAPISDFALRQPSNVGAERSLGLCPGVEYGPAKRWLPERFAEVATEISARTKTKWLLFGTNRDRAIGETITKTLGENCVNRIGETTMDELILELRNCRALLTNDTGTMHLAALLGIPLVAIFGSTEPALTGPLGNNHRIVRHHVECSPCFLRECPIDFRCMKEVTSEHVIDAMMSILR